MKALRLHEPNGRVVARSILSSFVALSVSAGPALAGPAGSGLPHTEQVARRAAAMKSAVRLTAPVACLSEAEAALLAAPSVRNVSRWGRELIVQVKEPGSNAAPALMRVVADACAAAGPAS